MAKRNEDKGALLCLAAVTVKVVAEHCRFMLHLTK